MAKVLSTVIAMIKNWRSAVKSNADGRRSQIVGPDAIISNGVAAPSTESPVGVSGSANQRQANVVPTIPINSIGEPIEFVIEEPELDKFDLLALQLMAELRAKQAAEPTRDRITRMGKESSALKDVCHKFYLAHVERKTPPEIEEGIVRDYAYVLGNTVDSAIKYPEDAHIHRAAISSFENSIAENRATRDALGLPITATDDEISQAYRSADEMSRKRAIWMAHPDVLAEAVSRINESRQRLTARLKSPRNAPNT